MEKDELNKIRSQVKDLTDSFRKMGRDMVDDSIPKAERFFFLTWLMYDQLLVQSNNRIQDFLNEIEES